jgi:hypothetical protein
MSGRAARGPFRVCPPVLGWPTTPRSAPVTVFPSIAPFTPGVRLTPASRPNLKFRLTPLPAGELRRLGPPSDFHRLMALEDVDRERRATATAATAIRTAAPEIEVLP